MREILRYDFGGLALNTQKNIFGTKKNGDLFTFFIIDDDNFMVRTLVTLVEAHGGFVLGTAGNREDALFQLSTFGNKVDILLIDIDMRKDNGLELLSEIRRHSKEVRALMVSAHATKRTIKESLLRGASFFVAKPFSTPEILKFIQKVCEEINTSNSFRAHIHGLDIFLIEPEGALDKFVKDISSLCKLEILKKITTVADIVPTLQRSKHAVHMILMDPQLPDGDGMSAIPDIMKYQPKAKLFVAHKKDSFNEMMRVGYVTVDEFFTQPIDEELFINKIIEFFFPQFLKILK